MSGQNFRVVSSVAMEKTSNDLEGPVCPICGKGTGTNSHFCFNCGAFVDASGSGTLQYGQVGDDVLHELVNQSDLAEHAYNTDADHIKVGNVTKRCLIVMLAGALFSAVTRSLLGVVVIVGSVVYMLRYTKKNDKPYPGIILNSDAFQKAINRYVAPGVLANVFDHVDSYDGEGTVELDCITSSHLVPGFDAWGGSQLVRAKHNGVDVEMCNITLQESHTDNDDNVTYSTVFDGPWINCNLGIPLAAPVYIIARRIGMRPSNNIETDHEEFNRNFFTFCSDSATAFRFLTPQVMEALLKVRNLSGGKVSIAALPDGQILIAIDSRRKLLYARDPHESLDTVRDRMENELQTPLMIVDMLNSARLYQ